MSEFIGSCISLISKSDIRYSGKLHNINSEDSTVALENVRSFGTEGRKTAEGKPNEEIAPSDGVYEYIVFRGSDVKDLRIDEAPTEPTPVPQVPNDPAILSGSRPTPQNPISQQQPYQQDHRHNHGPQFQQQQYQQYGQQPNQRFPGPPNGGPGYHGPPPPGYGHPGHALPGHGPPVHGGPPGMQFGPPPPGWYPPPGQGFGQRPAPFSPSHDHRMPQGPPAPQDNMHIPPPPQQQPQQNNAPLQPQNLNQGHSPAAQASTPAANQAVMQPKVELPASQPASQPRETSKQTPKAPSSKVALPMATIAAKNVTEGQAPAAPKSSDPTGPNTAQANAQAKYQDAARAASAAVAAAMSKLPAGPSNAQNGPGGVIDNLTQKVNEMRVDNRDRNPRGARGRGRGDFERGRGAFRGGRGGRGEAHGKGLEVPTTDFDFESANAKFNKEELVKEAIAGGEPTTTAEATNGTTSGAGLNGDGAKDDDDFVIPPPPVAYSKSSFFDNISSEAKDREEGTTAAKPRGGEFRSEERKRNMETFGLGSVDGGGFRGYGRGRGRGRGGMGPRGGFRGRGRAGSVIEA